jgi:ADP-glucose pyrophosphorylase
LLQKYQVFAHIFQGYWEDIGTVRAFFEANLALTDPVPAFNFLTPLIQSTPSVAFCRQARSAERRFSGR